MADRLDRDLLYRELKPATREAFLHLQREHPDERFYAFALYTHWEANYISPTSNTREALRRCWPLQ